MYRFLTGRAARERPASAAEIDSAPAPPTQLAMPRRAVLIGGIGAALGVATWQLVRYFEDKAVFAYDGLRPRGARLEPITPNEKFYVVTKNVIDPDIVKSIWRLEITGHVENSHTYDFDELAELPQMEQETTLMCISNRVGDILISNAVWSGVPMKTILDAAGVKEGAVEVILHGADGYTDTFAIENALDPTTLIAFTMNGEVLPERHGYPARVIVPGLFGEKNAKWLTGVEVVEKPAEGFYEQQGWGPSFVVPTRSLFYVPELREEFSVGTVLDLRGVAFAGNRGISSVEVSLDGGATWQPTEIDYAGTELTWSLWSYDWRPTQPGEYTLVVRATDGTGELQTDVKRGIISEGATGLHSVKATIVA
jgi:DMSO/TMAO reductase YedYZ molybdopterin-dependent catalytic subunit